MIRYLTDDEKRKSEFLYRAAFPEDKDEFVKYYYSYVTKDNKILVLEQKDEICSMLHLNPYTLSINGTRADAYYYVAVATREDCRHQGMMRKLLHQSLNDIHKEGHPFTYLMPANKAIYEPFDFRIVYQQKKVELPWEPKAANEKMAELFDVYTLRDDWYVEKMLEEERVCAGEAPFDIVPYIMARITHVEKMLELLRSVRPMQMLLQVQDAIIEENCGVFLWVISENSSVCEKISNGDEDASDRKDKAILEEHIHQKIFIKKTKDQNTDDAGLHISVTVAELTEFVFGKKNIAGLEDVMVLKRICINEAV